MARFPARTVLLMVLALVAIGASYLRSHPARPSAQAARPTIDLQLRALPEGAGRDAGGGP